MTDMHQITHETLPLIEEIFTVDSSWERENCSSLRCVHGNVTHTTTDSTTLKHIWAEIIALSGSI